MWNLFVKWEIIKYFYIELNWILLCDADVGVGMGGGISQ